MCANKLLLADQDMEYGRALARAVSGLHNEFEITLRSKDIFDNCNQFDLILVGGFRKEELSKIGRKEKCNEKLVFLSDGCDDNLMDQEKENGRPFWSVNKYQSVKSIISDLDYIIGFVSGKKSIIQKNSAVKLIGFYSIGGGTGNTSIALGTSRELSRYHEKKVLYLSFEEISATGLIIKNSPENRTIGDYLYFLLEKKNMDLCSKPESFLSSDEYGVDMFCPSLGRNDLNLLTREELHCFIKTVSNCGRYDFIVFDLKSDLHEETLFLMSLCSRIIITQDDNPVSKHKTRKLIPYLENLNELDFRGRLVLAINKSCSALQEESDPILYRSEAVTIIHVEKDERSFRFSSNHMDIDINHSFGIGIKKIADTI